MAKATPKHILKLNRDEKRTFIESFDLILSDCDGVLWNLSEPVKGSGAAVKLLRDFGKRISFVTNNSIRTEEGYMELFNRAGIETDINELIHPSKSIVSYLRRIGFEGLIYCIGTKTLKGVLRDAGYEIIDGPDELLEESFKVLLTHVFNKQPVKAVVMDIDFNLSALKLMKADQFMKKNDCILICGATDMTLPVGKYGAVIGPGPYLKILEASSNKKAKILGKPGNELKEIILASQSVGCPKRVLFIGDMLEQDIKFGQMCGFQTLLVLTGGTSKEDLMKISDPELLPNYYADSLNDFVEFFGSLEYKTSL